MHGLVLRLAIILCMASCLAPTSGNAQTDEKSAYFFSLNYRTGKIEPHSPKVSNLTFPCQGVDLKFGWQTQGYKYWQQAYRLPSYGVGLNWNTFGTDIIGEPFAAYFYTNFPQLSTKYFRIDFEINMGLSMGINPYDPISNPENFAIGSKLNNYFGFFLEQSIYLGKHATVFAAEGFSHYSNGATAYPNYGLNVPLLKFGLRYQPQAKEAAPKFEKTKFRTQVDLVTYFSSGIHSGTVPGEQYFGYCLAPAVYIRPGYKRRIGLGYEVAYDEAMTTVYEKRNYQGKQLLTQAVFVAHEYLIERISILSQFGYYLTESPFEIPYYERLGLGFRITPWFRTMLALKAHKFTAEYIELALAFDLHIRQ